LCITPEDICSRDSWMSRGDMLQHDLVHLTPRGLILLRDFIHRGIIYLNSDSNPKPCSAGDFTMPEGLNFAQLVGGLGRIAATILSWQKVSLNVLTPLLQ